MEEICEVDVDALRVSPFQPRRYFSEEELEELADSIKAVGLIHPPVVRKIQNRDKLLYYELIAGERRWRAVKRAGFKTIKVIVRESTDEDAAKATLIENVQRVDLSPLEMAHAFKRLIDIFRMTQEEVADKVGKKRSTVANYLRLLTLPQGIQETVSKGEITMGHAKAILSLDGEELQHKLHTLIAEEKMTVREAEKESLRMAQKEKNDGPHLTALQDRLREQLQTKVAIVPTGQTQGKIEIHYFSFDDLDRLLGCLGAAESSEI